MLTKLIKLSKDKAVVAHYSKRSTDSLELIRITPSKGKFPDTSLIKENFFHSLRLMESYLKDVLNLNHQSSLVDRILFTAQGTSLILSKKVDPAEAECRYLKKHSAILLLDGPNEVKLEEHLHYAWRC